MKKLLLSLAVLGLMAFPFALASANGKASCVGLSASDHARDGTLQEVIAFVRTITDQRGLGSVLRVVAQVHAGSHQACEQP